MERQGSLYYVNPPSEILLDIPIPEARIPVPEDSEKSLAFLSEYICQFSFEKVNCLTICSPLLENVHWCKFVGTGVALIKKLAGSVSEGSTLLTLETLRQSGQNVKTSRGSSPQQSKSSLVVSESNKALKQEIDRIQKEIKGLQQLLKIQMTFLQMEDEALKQLWFHEERWRKLPGIKSQSIELEQLFERKKLEVTAKDPDHDVHCAQLAKKIVQFTVPLTKFYEKAAIDLWGGLDEVRTALLRNANMSVRNIQELYEKEADALIDPSTSYKDLDSFSEWDVYYLEVRRTFTKLLKIKEEIHALDYIYYYADRFIGVTEDYKRLNSKLEIINDNYGALRIPQDDMNEKEKIRAQKKIASLDKMKKEIVELQKNNAYYLEKLNRDYSEKAKSEAQNLYEPLGEFLEAKKVVKDFDEMEEPEEIPYYEINLLYDPKPFVEARSKVRLKATKLLNKIAALMRDVEVCVYNRYQYADTLCHKERVEIKYKQIEVKKTKALKNIKEALEELQLRSSILTSINKEIEEKTINLKRFLPEFKDEEKKQPSLVGAREITMLGDGDEFEQIESDFEDDKGSEASKKELEEGIPAYRGGYGSEEDEDSTTVGEATGERDDEFLTSDDIEKLKIEKGAGVGSTETDAPKESKDKQRT